MLNITQHYNEDSRRCPINEVEYTGEKFPISASNVKRFGVKVEPGRRELYDIFIKLAVATYANGGKVDAVSLGRLAILVAQEAAKAGFADMVVDFRTEEGRKREREAAAVDAKRKDGVITYGTGFLKK